MFKQSLLILVLFVCFPLLSRAQIFKSVNLQLNLGTAIPFEAKQFEQYWNPGIHVGGGLEFSISDMFALKWEAAFNSFIFKHEAWKTDLINEFSTPDNELSNLVINGGNRYILESAVGAKFFPTINENINPYLSLSVGIAYMETDDIIIENDGPDFSNETIPYFTAGLGTEVSYWEGFSLFGQIVYKYAQTEDEYNFFVPLDFFKPPFKETSLFAAEFGIIFNLTL